MRSPASSGMLSGVRSAWPSRSRTATPSTKLICAGGSAVAICSTGGDCSCADVAPPGTPRNRPAEMTLAPNRTGKRGLREDIGETSKEEMSEIWQLKVHVQATSSAFSISAGAGNRQYNTNLREIHEPVLDIIRLTFYINDVIKDSAALRPGGT